MKLALPASVKNFLHRYHLTLFIVLIAGGLAFVVLSLMPIINPQAPQDEEPSQSATIPKLDKATIKQVDSLQSNGTPAPMPAYPGRTNPFAE